MISCCISEPLIFKIEASAPGDFPLTASEITLSPIHKVARDEIRKDAGLALRFPKFTGKIRVEKMAEDASTDDEVISLYKGQNKAAHDKNLI